MIYTRGSDVRTLAFVFVSKAPIACSLLGAISILTNILVASRTFHYKKNPLTLWDQEVLFTMKYDGLFNLLKKDMFYSEIISK